MRMEIRRFNGQEAAEGKLLYRKRAAAQPRAALLWRAEALE